MRFIILAFYFSLGPFQLCFATEAQEKAPATDIEPKDSDLFHEFKEAGIPLRFDALPSWQGKDRCGLNCVYAMLRLNHVRISYRDLEQKAGPVPTGGFNMQKLKELCESCGFPVEVIHGSISHALRLDPPLILHIGNLESPGHFMCVASHANGSYVLLDGTSGTIKSYSNGTGVNSIASLERASSGYFLVPKDKLGYSFGFKALVLFGITFGLVIVWMGKRHLQSRRV